MPGEVLSPTQPFPTRPAPFDYQRVTIDDLVDFTPEIRAMAVEAVSDPRRHRGLRLALRGAIRPTTMRPRQTGSSADVLPELPHRRQQRRVRRGVLMPPCGSNGRHRCGPGRIRRDPPPTPAGTGVGNGLAFGGGGEVVEGLLGRTDGARQLICLRTDLFEDGDPLRQVPHTPVTVSLGVHGANPPTSVGPFDARCLRAARR